MERAVAMFDRNSITELRVDLPGAAFVEQHCDNLFGRAVAEQLTKGLFVPGDAVPFDQGNELFRGMAAQCRLGEMRVGREEVGRRGADVGEIAPPAAGNEDLGAGIGHVVDQQDAAAALPGERGAIEAGRAGADNDRVIGAGGRHGAALAGCGDECEPARGIRWRSAALGDIEGVMTKDFAPTRKQAALYYSPAVETG